MCCLINDAYLILVMMKDVFQIIINDFKASYYIRDGFLFWKLNVDY